MVNLKCRVCGAEFPATRKNHYVCRCATQTGLAAFSGDKEPTLFDAFDCPNCGCQIIKDERKRSYPMDANMTEEEVLKKIGYGAIADFLGLPKEMMNAIREAKENGGKISFMVAIPGNKNSTGD